MPSPSRIRQLASLSVVVCALGCGRVGFGRSDTAPDARADSALDGRADSRADAPADSAPDTVADAADAGVRLVDRGVLVRYFLDEGTTAGPIASSGAPLDLAFVPAVTVITSVAESTGAGFAFPVAGNDDRICAPIAGSAIEMLDGGTKGTIEAVAELVEGVPEFSRVADVGLFGEWGFSMGFTSVGRRLVFSMNRTRIIYGDWSDMPAGRHVFTVVLDLDRGAAEDRLKVYVDGLLGPVSSGPALAGSEILSVGADSQLCLGNRSSVSRGLLGRVYYVAYYSSALSAAEVSTNAARLLANDD